MFLPKQGNKLYDFEEIIYSATTTYQDDDNIYWNYQGEHLYTINKDRFLNNKLAKTGRSYGAWLK